MWRRRREGFDGTGLSCVEMREHDAVVGVPFVHVGAHVGEIAFEAEGGEGSCGSRRTARGFGEVELWDGGGGG